MAIYGTALLAFCLICGLIIGELIGRAIGIAANVGGVGFAMLLLIVLSDQLQSRGRIEKSTTSGVLFWSAIYVPIVVAMAASQNVRAAINGGAMAIIAGLVAVVMCFALVPVLSRSGEPNMASPTETDETTKEGNGV